MAKIAARNDIRDPRELREGQRLEIPVPAPPATAGTELAKSEPPARPGGASTGEASGGPAAEAAPEAPAAAPAGAATEPASQRPVAEAPAPESVALQQPPSAPADTERAEAGLTDPAPAAEAPAPRAGSAPAPQALAADDPQPAGEATPRSYVIAPGDTLGSIGRRFGVGAEELAAANGISDPRSLRPGQVLELPGGAAAPGARAAAEPPTASPPRAEAVVASAQPAPQPPRTYTVAPGDTLGSIGRRFGVAPAELAAASGVSDPRRLRPGQVLELPAGAGAAADAPPPPPRERIYTVRQGDTLYSIAARHGLRVADIAEHNGLKSRHRLSIGQRLRLPAEGS
jgi:LysM repeat protein